LRRRGAARRNEAGKNRDECCDGGPDEAGHRLQAAERDAHVVAVEAVDRGGENESGDDAAYDEPNIARRGVPNQFRVQSVSVETSFTKIRLPESAGCVHVSDSATL
jgi:hypothetical protein